MTTELPTYWLRLILVCLVLSVLTQSAHALTFVEAQRNTQNGVTGLDGVNATALSPDGLHLYAANVVSNAVTVFNRDLASGRLTFNQTLNNATINDNGLGGAADVVVSPDGRHVYVASQTDSAVTVFTRNATTGQLTLVEIQKDNINNANGLLGASALAMTPDGTRLFVAGTGENVLTSFSRNGDTGVLTPVAALVDDVNADGLASVTDLALTVIGDNTLIYASGLQDNAIGLFVRNAGNELAYGGVFRNGTGNIANLIGPSAVTISPENTHLYVAAANSNAVVAFTINQATGGLTFLTSYVNNQNGVSGLAGARSILANPDGQELYAAGVNDNAVAVFDRAADGTLTPQQTLKNNQNTITSLAGARGLTATGDGRQLYISALFSDAISVFSVVSSDLTIAMTDDDPVAINSTLNYTLTVTNNGPDTSTGVTVTQTLPAGVTFQEATGSQGSCSHDSGTVTCAVGNIPANSNATLTVSVGTPATVGTGLLSTEASVSSGQPDPDTTNNNATLSSRLQLEVKTIDLALTGAPNANPASVSSNLLYNLTVANNGIDTASEIVLTATLHSSLIYDSTNSDARCVLSNQNLICSLGSLASGASTPVPIQVSTPAVPSSGPLPFSATVSATEKELTPANNSLTLPVSVEVLTFDLAIVEALANPNTTPVNTPIAYQLTISNLGGSATNNARLQVSLPPEVQYVSDTAQCERAPAALSCDLGILDPVGNPSTNLTINVIGVLPEEQTEARFSVFAAGTDTNQTNNQALVIATVSGQAADLSLTINSSANTVIEGAETSLSFVVNNNGPGWAMAPNLSGSLSGVPFTLTGLTGGTCNTGNNFTCTLEDIEPGSSATITVQLTPTDIGTLAINGEVSSSVFDPVLPNNADSAEIAVSAPTTDLAVTLETTPTTVLVEGVLTYTATITNNGPSPADNVSYRQTLSNTVTFTSAESSLQVTPCAEAAGVVTCDLGPLAVNGVATVLVRVTPNNTTTINSEATVSSTTLDPVQANNTVAVSTNVSLETADLALTVTADQDPVLVDNPLAFRVALNNTGPQEAEAVQLALNLPNSLTITGFSLTPATAGSCAPDADNGQIIRCTLPGLPLNSEPLFLDVQTIAEVAEVVTATATVSSATHDNDETNNTAQVTVRANTPSTLYFVEAVLEGTDSVQGVRGVYDITLSPDGQFLYAASFTSSAVAVFSRNSSTGKLSFLQVLNNETANVSGLFGAAAIDVTPDGRHVYVSGFSDSTVVVFARNQTTGLLSFVASYQNGVDGFAGLAGPFGLIASDNYVYIAANGDKTISVLQRNSDTGELTFVTTTSNSSLDGTNGLALSPDGTTLAAANANTSSIAIFSINADGSLNQTQLLSNNIGGVTGLGVVKNVAFSPDGNSLYAVAAGTENALVVFSRAGNGQYSFVEVLRNGVNGVQGLNGVEDVAVNANGSYVYTASTIDNAVAVFVRNPTDGRLTYVDVLRDNVNEVNGLAGARALALGPAGVFVYVAGSNDNAIGVLRVASTDVSLTIRDNKDPVTLNDALTYSLTVTNNGPDRATDVVLLTTLPGTVQFQSVTAHQGSCDPQPTAGNQLSCRLGTIQPSSHVLVTLAVTPTTIGELLLNSTVSSSELDSVPANNSVTEATQVTATADLELLLTANPDPASLNGRFALTAQVTNKGPDTAQGIQVSISQPAATTFISAASGTDQTLCSQSGNTVLCQLGDLAAGGVKTATLTLVPTQVGTLSATATVNSGTLDPVAENNADTHTLQVLLNLIEDTRDNSGQTLSNYTIANTGAVRGGTLDGTITNEGLIYDVVIAEGALVQGGGRLSKVISNRGTIQDAQLLGGTVINGGVLSGVITGFPTAPATLNGVRVTSGSTLSHAILGGGSVVESGVTLNNVVINPGVTLSPGVILGPGVVFSGDDSVPDGLDLTPILPSIVDPITGSVAVNLAFDVTTEGTSTTQNSVLAAINALPLFRDNGLVATQDATHGQVLIPVGNEVYVLLPWQVRQASGPVMPGIQLEPDGSVQIMTENGRLILLEPALANSPSMQATLRELGLATVEAHSNGTYRVPLSADSYGVLQAQRITQAATDAVQGIVTVPSADIQGQVVLLHRFSDAQGQAREQLLYPAAAYSEEFASALRGIAGVSGIQFLNNGSFLIKINELTYTVVFDYVVTRGGPATSITQLLLVTDRNNDGWDEVLVTYANGDQQLLYVKPQPLRVAAVQTIPDVQRAGYLVTASGQDELLLISENNHLRLRVNNETQLEETTPTRVTVSPDGSIEFVSLTGVLIETQPLLQDSALLMQALRGFGDFALTEFENGNVLLTHSDGVQVSARPDLVSTPAGLLEPLGLSVVRSSVAVNQVMYVLTFRSDVKRQQVLYPAAREPEALLAFLQSFPTVNTVQLNNDGTVLIEAAAFTFRGLFDYVVTNTGIATGTIQIAPGADFNADGVPDFVVTYGDGSQQVIYSLP